MDFQQFYWDIPPVTRFYCTTCFLTTLAVRLELITAFQIYFNPVLIFKGFQVEFLSQYSISICIFGHPQPEKLPFGHPLPMGPAPAMLDNGWVKYHFLLVNLIDNLHCSFGDL